MNMCSSLSYKYNSQLQEFTDISTTFTAEVWAKQTSVY